MALFKNSSSAYISVVRMYVSKAWRWPHALFCLILRLVHRTEFTPFYLTVCSSGIFCVLS